MYQREKEIRRWSYHGGAWNFLSKRLTFVSVAKLSRARRVLIALSPKFYFAISPPEKRLHMCVIIIIVIVRWWINLHWEHKICTSWGTSYNVPVRHRSSSASSSNWSVSVAVSRLVLYSAPRHAYTHVDLSASIAHLSSYTNSASNFETVTRALLFTANYRFAKLKLFPSPNALARVLESLADRDSILSSMLNRRSSFTTPRRKWDRKVYPTCVVKTAIHRRDAVSRDANECEENVWRSTSPAVDETWTKTPRWSVAPHSSFNGCRSEQPLSLNIELDGKHGRTLVAGYACTRIMRV